MNTHRSFRRPAPAALVSVALLLLVIPASLAGILVIAPHPDDDIITSAGVIYSALQRGDAVQVVFMTNGDWAGLERGLERQDEACTAQIDYLGMTETNLIFLGYPDGYLADIIETTRTCRIS